MQSTVNFISDGLGLTPSEYAQVLLECTANGSVRTDCYALGGARLFVEAVHRDRAPAQQAALFDTVFVSLFKCFNSAAGAILAGPAAVIQDLYHQRRMFGGSLAQAI